MTPQTRFTGIGSPSQAETVCVLQLLNLSVVLATASAHRHCVSTVRLLQGSCRLCFTLRIRGLGLSDSLPLTISVRRRAHLAFTRLGDK